MVGVPHPLKGEGIVAFLTLKKNKVPPPHLKDELKNHVVKKVGALARPEEIYLVEQLPKTRSGKIMRRLLRQIAAKEKVSGDITTLEDLGVISQLTK